MKKLCCLVVSVLIFMGAAIECYAVNGTAVLNLTADSVINPNKDFYVYLEINANVELGAFLVNLNYNNQSLLVKSVEIENKNQNEKLKYNDTNGTVYIMYGSLSVSKSKTIKIRFANQSAGAASYHFEAYLTDGSDLNGVPIQETNSALKIDISDNGTVSQIKYNNSGDVKENSRTISRNESSSITQISPNFQTGTSVSNSSVQNFDLVSESEENEDVTESISKTKQGEYFLNDDDDMKQDHFLVFVCFVAVIVAAVLIAYKMGMKNAKNDDEN